MPKFKKLAILSGGGDLPKKVAEKCHKENIPYFVIGLKGFVDHGWIDQHPHQIIPIGFAGKIFKTLKSQQADHVVLAGNIRRPSWKEMIPDIRGALLIKKFKKGVQGDNSILTVIADEIENEGYKVIGAHEICTNLLAVEKKYTNKNPTQEDLLNIKNGFNILADIGRADIGQSLVIQDGLILGVEAIEGTDELVRRCAQYKRKTKHPLLIKGKKPHQDERIDLPTIGLKTVQNVVRSGFSGIAIQAEKTIFLEQEQAIALANQHNVFIIGFKPSSE